MTAQHPTAMVLIGPRRLNDRICRLMYVRETEEVWTEEWSDRAWVRVPVLARDLMKAPSAARSTLKRRGITCEVGAMDREQACA